jgi:hypothetical protein
LAFGAAEEHAHQNTDTNLYPTNTPTHSPTATPNPIAYSIVGYIQDTSYYALSGQKVGLYYALTGGLQGAFISNTLSDRSGHWGLSGSAANPPTNFAGFRWCNFPLADTPSHDVQCKNANATIVSANTVDWRSTNTSRHADHQPYRHTECDRAILHHHAGAYACDQ